MFSAVIAVSARPYVLHLVSCIFVPWSVWFILTFRIAHCSSVVRPGPADLAYQPAPPKKKAIHGPIIT